MLSPALSVNSETSRSPNVFPNKQPVSTINNHRLNFTGCLSESRAVNQNHVTEAVPRTHSSNKRLRKSEPVTKAHGPLQPGPSFTDIEPDPKRQRLNGDASCSSVNSQVPNPSLNEQLSQHSENSLTSESTTPTLKKRGRKKGSKTVKPHQLIEDDIKEKLASIARNPKVKTTQELLADLQARGSNSSFNLNPLPSHNTETSNEKVLRSEDGPKSKYQSSLQNNFSESSLQGRLSPEVSRQKKSKFGKSETECNSEFRDDDDDDDEDDDDEEEEEEEDTRPQQKDITVKEILAKLPPLDLKSIVWSDNEEVEEHNDDENGVDLPPREVSAEDLERLQMRCVEGLNGNYQPKFSSLILRNNEKADNQEDAVNVEKLGLYRRVNEKSDEEFREWHEMLARPTYDGQILHILPYVIID